MCFFFDVNIKCLSQDFPMRMKTKKTDTNLKIRKFMKTKKTDTNLKIRKFMKVYLKSHQIFALKNLTFPFWRRQKKFRFLDC